MRAAATLASLGRAVAGGAATLAERVGLTRRTRKRALQSTQGPMRFIARFMPRGLYGRSLVIVIAPVVLLQSVVAYVFMERHWQLVTRRLSAAVAADISALMDVYQSYPQDRDAATLQRIAQRRLNLDVDILRNAELPPPGPRPFFSLLDQALSRQLALQISQPFWLDTVGASDFIEIRVQVGQDVMRVIARRSAAYASNSHIFLVWMLGASLVLLTIAILFLRNQIRPILSLADAAGELRQGPRGRVPSARRDRGEAGRTRLPGDEAPRRADSRRAHHDAERRQPRPAHHPDALPALARPARAHARDRRAGEEGRRRDEPMLEAYLAFARGEAGEIPTATDIRALLEELKADAERQGHATTLSVTGDPVVVIRPDAIRRVLTNLVSNAARHGDRITIAATHDARYLIVTVDDDGPGIPPEMRDEVFKPFVRLDEARNVDEGGTGLGLAISRDIARGHGGDITLLDSPMGGLRAMLRLPV